MIPGVLWYIILTYYMYVEKSVFDANYKAKYTINNRKLIRFPFSHAIKADKKRKLKLKIINA